MIPSILAAQLAGSGRLPGDHLPDHPAVLKRLIIQLAGVPRRDLQRPVSVCQPPI